MVRKKRGLCKKKVCNFRGEEGRGRRKKRIEYMPKSAGFALKRKKVAFKEGFQGDYLKQSYQIGIWISSAAAVAPS